MQQQAFVNGVPVHWMEHGRGRPVVLLHGIPTSPLLWRHVMPLIEGHSLAWEMLGYGTSAADADGHDIGLSSQADRLLAWMDAIELDQPLLVGHDLGGGVAQIAATREPQRFGGLVLTNAVCYDSWPIPSVKAMQRLAGALRHLPGPAIYPSLAQLLVRGHDDLRTAREAIGVHWRPYANHGAARTLMRQVSSLDVGDTLDVADRLSTLRLPARVVWGDADRFQKVRYGERLAHDLGCSLTRIRGGKHFTPEDHPGDIAHAVNSLLAR